MYTSKSATLIGACCSTLTPPSPRPMPNTARPFERPCTVAIASDGLRVTGSPKNAAGRGVNDW